MEEEIDNFYNSVDNAKALYKVKEITIIMGDLNAKFRKEWEGKIVGKIGHMFISK